MHGALMVCGTGSDAGKSHVVTGLCRALLRRGVLRAALLGAAARRRGRTLQASGVSFAVTRERQLDRLADLVEDHLDLTAIDRLIQESA